MQSLILLLLFFLFLVSLAAAATYHQYSDCAPTPFTCGNLTFDVSYPFRIPGRVDYCGFPGFDLSCIAHNSTPIITIENYGYKILAVDYPNKILTVVDANLTAPSCPKPHRNITLHESSHYLLADRNEDLTFFANCVPPDPLPSILHHIGCLDDGDRRSYYSLGNRISPEVLEKCGSTVVVPVDRGTADRMANGVLEFGEALRKGLSVQWMPGKGWCRDCMNSGGVCGFNDSYPNDQACYFPDGYALGKCLMDGVTGKENTTWTLVLVIVIPIVGVLALVSSIYACLKWRRKVRRKIKGQDGAFEVEITTPRTILFDLSGLRDATDNFSDANKLGQGGFGSVYNGVLPDGQQIAVKRLSRSSSQGIVELRNEVDLVAKLQHRNLVTLLGFCLGEQEKLLVYEYLSNGSLDRSLFGNRPDQKERLDWRTRYKIIEGIGRGLRYLHEDSCLKVIHRDLKASNILLDGDMNPIISDFGLARLFGINETQRFTRRLAGTYGYMPPEYIEHKQFSTKSDVYSYGVLVLEIVTGRKNSGFEASDNASSGLLGHVWKQWNEEKAVELVDQNCGAFQLQEVLRCIQIGLLCVQGDPKKRPDMGSVTLMLSTHLIAAPPPSMPGFYEAEVASSVNLETITEVQPR